MKLREYLKESGLTQCEFAAASGISQQNISKYCKRGTLPGRQRVLDIERATGGKVTAADFYSDMPTSPRRGSAGRPLKITSAAGRKAALATRDKRRRRAEAGAAT